MDTLELLENAEHNLLTFKKQEQWASGNPFFVAALEQLRTAIIQEQDRTGL